MTEKQREQYTELLRGRLSGRRFEHSINVSAEAARLAKKYGADIEKAELAGLLHDIMKEAGKDVQLEYVRLHYNNRVPKDMLASPKLWHAVAGAEYLRRELKLRDKDLLCAVCYHTSGRAGMSLLEKIVYIADYISAERTFDGVGALRKSAYKSLSAAMFTALQFTITNLAEKGSPIHPYTTAAYNEIVAQSGENSRPH